MITQEIQAMQSVSYHSAAMHSTVYGIKKYEGFQRLISPLLVDDMLRKIMWTQLTAKESSLLKHLVLTTVRGYWAGWYFRLMLCNHVDGVPLRQHIK